MNKITITVEGDIRTGKSTIAQQISGQLQVAGFPVTLKFINDEHEARSTPDHLKAMASIRDTVEIEVIESQVSRKQA
jgi:deoxyadenosine/deoxycytidine kinase